MPQGIGIPLQTATATAGRGTALSEIEMVLIIAGAAGAIYGLKRLAKASSARRQIFTATSERDGTDTSRQLRFTAPVDAASLCECIVQRVNAQAGAPIAASALYVSQRSDNSVVFAWGSLMSTSMRAKVVTRRAEHGSSGSFEVLDRTGPGANVEGSGVVGPLIDRIKSAVSDAGGSTSEGWAER